MALWDVGHHARLADVPLALDAVRVFRVVFSPDGKTLAAGHQEGVVLWDMGHRALLADAPPVVADGNVESVAFSPDRHTLASGHRHFGTGGGVVLWNVDFDSWPRLARWRANRNLTRAEWRQYFPGEDYRRTFDDLPKPPETDPSHFPAQKVRSYSAIVPESLKTLPCS